MNKYILFLGSLSFLITGLIHNNDVYIVGGWVLLWIGLSVTIKEEKCQKPR